MREIWFRVFYKRDNRMIEWESLKHLLEGYEEPFVTTEDWKVMQFTGLLDKNGKEIYEGDIVNYTLNDFYENIGEVIYVDKTNFMNYQTYPFAFGFILHSAKYNRTDTFQGNESEFLEVIGNIYENSNLLESEK